MLIKINRKCSRPSHFIGLQKAFLAACTLFESKRISFKTLEGYVLTIMLNRIVGGPPPRLPFIEKPFGYSTFPKDVMPVPVSWAATTAKLIFFKKHTSGGRFPVSCFS